MDASPGLLAADWAAALAVPDTLGRPGRPGPGHGGGTGGDGAGGGGPGEPAGRRPAGAARAATAAGPAGPDGARFAVAPFERAGLVLLVARTDGDELPPVGFHRTEVDRLAQLVRAAAAVLGARLERIEAPVGV